MKLFAALAVVLSLSACTPPGGVDSWTYEITLSVLPDLTEGRYAAWAISPDATPVLLLEFTEGAGGVVEASVDPELYDELLISLHPSDGELTEPSAAVMFRAALEVWGGDLVAEIPIQSVSGSMRMWTPTDGSPDAATAGAWFGDAELAPTLLVPVLSDGFRWESWVETQDTTLSMGRFATADGGDDGCPHCDDVEPAPAVPGEDFLVDLPAGFDPVDLADGASRLWVSLEPDLDGLDPQGATPFFTVLSTAIAKDAAPGETIELFGPDMPGILGSVNVLSGDFEG